MAEVFVADHNITLFGADAAVKALPAKVVLSYGNFAAEFPQPGVHPRAGFPHGFGAEFDPFHMQLSTIDLIGIFWKFCLIHLAVSLKNKSAEFISDQLSSRRIPVWMLANSHSQLIERFHTDQHGIIFECGSGIGIFMAEEITGGIQPVLSNLPIAEKHSRFDVIRSRSA